MPTYTRNNAWNNNGTFDNPDLLWYAKAVRVMQSKAIAEPDSWWFYAAIHGEFLLAKSAPPPAYSYVNWINIKYIPQSAQINSVPSKKLTDQFWDQCQHATWYFPPWHRGYLAAIENILRAIIIQLNGPSDWALPYWNYLNQSTSSDQSKIPPAFTMQHLPDGSANPLFVSERYGPSVAVGNGENQANDQCQWDTIYDEGSTKTRKGPGDLTGFFYGGGKTGFVNQGGSDTGDLEDNPHNTVHGAVGGTDNSTGQGGLMAFPPTAALDPIFYLHHANIDRMWTAWNETGKNIDTSDPSWLAGPVAQGNSQFVMPLDANGTPWYYTPEDMLTTTNLKYNGTIYSYTYDDLSLTSYNNTPPTQLRRTLLERFASLNVTGNPKDIKMTNKRNYELVGASKGSVTLKGSELNTSIKLNTTAWKSVSNSLSEASFSSPPDEVFLQLEGVKGGSDANFLSVYINGEFVKSVSLFGLLSASMKGSAHGGAGLIFKFNITNIIDNLHLNGKIDIDSLDVQIKAKNKLPGGGEITIGRIGVYRVNP